MVRRRRRKTWFHWPSNVMFSWDCYWQFYTQASLYFFSSKWFTM